jgi:hypothetical protein
MHHHALQNVHTTVLLLAEGTQATALTDCTGSYTDRYKRTGVIFFPYFRHDLFLIIFIL